MHKMPHANTPSCAIKWRNTLMVPIKKTVSSLLLHLHAWRFALENYYSGNYSIQLKYSCIDACNDCVNIISVRSHFENGCSAIDVGTNYMDDQFVLKW